MRLSFGYSVADESGKEMEIQPGTLVTCRTSAEPIRAIRAHFANRANNKCLYFRVLDLYPLRVLDLYPLRVLDMYPKPAKHHQNLQGCGKKHVGSAASPSEDSIFSSWKSASWESTEKDRKGHENSKSYKQYCFVLQSSIVLYCNKRKNEV